MLPQGLARQAGLTADFLIYIAKKKTNAPDKFMYDLQSSPAEGYQPRSHSRKHLESSLLALIAPGIIVQVIW